MSEWIVWVDRDQRKYGSVTADTEEQALELAHEQFVVMEGDGDLHVRPIEPGESVFISLPRLRSMRHDDLSHNIPVGAIVEIPNFNRFFEEQTTGRWPDTKAIEGTQIEIEGRARLYIVGHTRDCDGTPLYMVSAAPIGFPSSIPDRMKYALLARFSDSGYSEESLVDTGHRVEVQSFEGFIDSLRPGAESDAR